MGACSFRDSAIAKTADEAFKSLTDAALWESGHGGYSGTIAEKSSRGFVRVEVPSRVDPDKLSHWIAGYYPGWGDEKEEFLKGTPRAHRGLVRKYSDLYFDKWGPALCVRLKKPTKKLPRGHHQYVFFGMASS